MPPTDKPNFLARSLIGWIPLGFLIALGVHGLVLFVPLSSSQEMPASETADEEPVTISRLPLDSKTSDSQENLAPARTGAATAQNRSASGSSAQAGSGRSAQTNSRTTRSNQANRSNTRRNNSSSRRQTTTESESRSAEEEIAALPPDSPASNPAAGNPSTPAAAPETPNRTQGLTALLAYAKTLAAQPMIASDSLLSYIAYLRRAYAYSPLDTTPAEATANLARWTAQIEAEADVPVASPTASKLMLEYPLKICLEAAPKPASVGAWVTARGALADDPVLLKSTGYAGLNEKAIAVVKEQTFADTSQPRAYVYEVAIDYDPDRCLQPTTSEQTDTARL
ncbi:MAG: hypothetical protein HC886_03195 [Leptolyngbyaceae cyanobacterium SM1_1_3]|nr:hypothetical protein [Leptolyngbyaceae cyanobacterium SM1_1_3]NJN02100.1 hypothetical protein [Leptolyngbyaceae cyanobacterium RM1_1_2]NJO09709.1 hypothetical protein [Leptolyngbyaceae cyanobacterium SL_1_1]